MTAKMIADAHEFMRIRALPETTVRMHEIVRGNIVTRYLDLSVNGRMVATEAETMLRGNVTERRYSFNLTQTV